MHLCADSVHLTHTYCWDPAGCDWYWCWCPSSPCTSDWLTCSCSPTDGNPRRWLGGQGEVESVHVRNETRSKEECTMNRKPEKTLVHCSCFCVMEKKEKCDNTCEFSLQEDGHLVKHVSAQLVDVRLCRLHSLLCCLHTTITYTITWGSKNTQRSASSSITTKIR